MARTKWSSPSRHENLFQHPAEVALWARENGPVVVAPSVGGFVIK
jgi:hypothetical protein